jgi:hypothetical protein
VRSVGAPYETILAIPIHMDSVSESQHGASLKQNEMRSPHSAVADVLRGVLATAGRTEKIGRDPRFAQHRPNAGLARPARPATGMIPIVWAGIGLLFLQQFSGMNVIFSNTRRRLGTRFASARSAFAAVLA